MTATASGIDTVFCQVGGCDWWCEGDEETRGEASEAHRLEEHPWVRAGSCFRLASAGGVDGHGRAWASGVHTRVEPPEAAPAAAAVSARKSGGRRKWTRESITDAIKAWASEHGAPPTANAWIKSAVDHPSSTTVAKYFGTWREAIAAAGFDAPKRGGRTTSAPKRQVGEPKAGKAAVPSGPPSAAEPEQRPTSAAPAAVLTPSPIPAAPSAEAGSPADAYSAWVKSQVDLDRLDQEYEQLVAEASVLQRKADALRQIIAAVHRLADLDAEEVAA